MFLCYLFCAIQEEISTRGRRGGSGAASSSEVSVFNKVPRKGIFGIREAVLVCCGVCEVDEGFWDVVWGLGIGGKMDFDSADIAEQIALKAVSLTHVRYAKGDQLGHALSWASLLPVFIGLGGFMSHFIFRRELQAMFFGLGLCVSEVINQVRWFVELIHLAIYLLSPSIASCAAVLF